MLKTVVNARRVVWADISRLNTKKHSTTIPRAVVLIRFKTDVIWIDAPLVPAPMGSIIVAEMMWFILEL
jgi:hypothetical protein